MSLSRTWMVIIIGLLLVAALAVAGVAGAWFAARASAIAMVANEPLPGPGLADTSWYDQLGGPRSGDIDVAAASPPEIVAPFELVFPLILTNTANQNIAPLSIQVTVGLTLHGWVLVGAGSGG